MSFWRKLAHWLSHDPAIELAKAERARIDSLLDALTDAANAEVLAVVRETLFHQGTPQGNVAHLLEVLHAGRSYGWDEADYELEGERVTVRFLDAEVQTDRTSLVALLERIRARL